MNKTNKIFLGALIAVQWVAFSARAATYQLDNNAISTVLNASDGTEPRDGWFGNVFTAVAGANQITAVDYGLFTNTPSSTGSVSIYLVTGAGGNPALGATRLYTQSFGALVGDGTNAFLQHINLTSPVFLSVGDKFLVSVLMRDVIAAPPNDVYPFLLDTSGVAAGTFWDRSNPNAFNLDDLSAAVPVNQPLTLGGFAPGAGHVIIRADGTAVPEPGTLALCGVAVSALIFRRRRNTREDLTVFPPINFRSAGA